MTNKPQYSRPQGGSQQEPPGMPMPDFVPMLIAMGILALAGLGALKFLQNMGIPLAAPFADAAIWFLTQLDPIIPHAAKLRIAASLTTQAEWAALGVWLALLPLAPFLLGKLTPVPKTFDRVLDLEQLIQVHAKHTLRVHPILNCDPREDKDPDGPWSLAPTHEHWATRYDLDLKAEVFPQAQIEAILTTQLNLANPAGPNRALLCVRAVQVVCLARILNGRDAGNELIDKFATVFWKHYLKDYVELMQGGPMPNDEAINTAWAHYSKAGKEWRAKAAALHAYPSTRTVWLLKAARAQSGVLEPSAFLWLRPTCRVLWAAVHQVGLNCANVEACAVYAQYNAEEQTGKAVKKPHFESVLWGIKQALYPCEDTNV